MAISYVGGQVSGFAGKTATTTVTFSFTGGSNSTPSTGDLIVVTYVVGSSVDRALTITTSTGAINYTLASTEQYSNGTTYDTNLRVAYRIYNSDTDGTGIILSGTGSTADAGSYTIQAFRGVDTTTPMDATPAPATGTATGRPNPAAITPATTGAWIVSCAGGSAATGANYTAPTGFTTNFLTINTVDNNDAMVGSGYYTGWTSGSYDPAAYTGGTTNAADSWAAITLALKPALNNYTLTCNNGSYTVTGQSATVSRNRTLTASNGSYAVTGQQVTITKAVSYILTAQHGTYTLTGQSANLYRNRNLTANNGSYALTGQNATLLRSKYITANTGSYTYTGISATLERDRTLTAQSGSYSLAGQSATIKRDKWLNALTTSITLNGQPVTISKSKVINAQAGSYSVTGSTADISYVGGANYTLVAETGVYNLTGQSASVAKVYLFSLNAGSYTYGEYYAEPDYVESGYWGNASITIGGQITGGAGGSRKKKRVFIEKDGDLLIFDNATQAAQYVEAQKEQEKAEVLPITADSRGLQRRKKPKPIPEPQIIKIDALEALIKHFQLQNDLTEMIQRQELDALIALQIKLIEMQDEEDIELLLLAA